MGPGGLSAGLVAQLIPGTQGVVVGPSPQRVRIWGGGSPNQTVCTFMYRD